VSDVALDSLEDQVEAQALDLAHRMQRSAEVGDWTDVHSLSVQLRDAVTGVPEDRRRTLLLSLKQSNNVLQSTVVDAKKGLEEQLSMLRQGRNATRAYQATGEMRGRRES
jgi:hypothetical protein